MQARGAEEEPEEMLTTTPPPLAAILGSKMRDICKEAIVSSTKINSDIEYMPGPTLNYSVHI